MARGFPSMTALLALLAIAGYQNRDKLAKLLSGPEQFGSNGTGEGPGQNRGLPTGLGGMLSGVGAGGLLSGGLQEILQRFTESGQGEVAQSWVGTGPNREVTPDELEQALGPDVMRSLAEKTGLSREDLLNRLTRTLPDAVNDLTPEGRVPSEGEAQGFAGGATKA